MDPNFSICDLEIETLVHCLFSCNRSKIVWRLTLGSDLVLPMGDTSLLQWTRDDIDNLGTIIPIIMWIIWCARNNFF